MLALKLFMPLLGVLLWVFSIHAGTFTLASILPPYLSDMKFSPALQKPEETPKSTVLKISPKNLNNSVELAQTIIAHLERLENSLAWSKIEVRHLTPTHGVLIESMPEREALYQGKDAMIATKATLDLMHFCDKHHLNSHQCARHISYFKLTSTPLRTACPQLKKICSEAEIYSKFRSLDGSCNHISNSVLGESFTPYTRLLFPFYLDGIQEPRRSVKRRYALPSPRFVSTSICHKASHVDGEITLAVMQWSQFIAHDLAHTPTLKMVHTHQGIECCDSDGSKLAPRYKHPFCEPISVPPNDEFYSKHEVECMTYVRSVPAMRLDCSLGPLEQMNQATHYLDGSQIYGSTFQRAFSLREMEGGLLQYSEHGQAMFLPVSKNPNEHCQTSSPDSFCYYSGDSRVNMHPQLTTMYTIWLREHNRIATLLGAMNPHWDDEILYQEARRIVIAEMQHITYNEWIPIVLGEVYANEIDSEDAYKENVDPSVSNSFATAAMRFVNSLMEGRLRLYEENRTANSSVSLKDHFNKPNFLEVKGVMDALIRGLATQASQQMDLNYIEDVTTMLYGTGDYGYDVLSLDIQRGRDHGLPPYTAYRTLCKLGDVHSFDDLRDVISEETINVLKTVYQHPNDIDLLVGGLSEIPSEGSLLGPTFSCIIGDQMWRTKYGDRYFYTNFNQPKPFTSAQLAELKKVTLARIFCENGVNIKTMQQNVFKRISDGNPLVQCNSPAIPSVDLTLWADNYTMFV